MCAEKVTKYNVCSLICVILYTRGHSLVSMVMYLNYLGTSHINANLLKLQYMVEHKFVVIRTHSHFPPPFLLQVIGRQSYSLLNGEFTDLQDLCSHSLQGRLQPECQPAVSVIRCISR